MTLDDATAISVLRSVAQARLSAGKEEPPPTPELQGLLARAFDSSVQAQHGNEAELARAALDVLREDPTFAATIQKIASDPSPSYFEPISLGIVTAAVLVLQTKVKFKVDHTGKWSLEVEKKSSGDPLVKSLVERLLPFLG